MAPPKNMGPGRGPCFGCWISGGPGSAGWQAGGMVALAAWAQGALSLVEKVGLNPLWVSHKVPVWETIQET